MTLTGLAEALLKAQERLEPEGLVTWERADAGRDRQGHLRGAPPGPLAGDGSLPGRNRFLLS